MCTTDDLIHNLTCCWVIMAIVGLINQLLNNNHSIPVKSSANGKCLYLICFPVVFLKIPIANLSWVLTTCISLTAPCYGENWLREVKWVAESSLNAALSYSEAQAALSHHVLQSPWHFSSIFLVFGKLLFLSFLNSYLSIYLLMAALGLPCCIWASSSCGEWRLPCCACPGFSLWWLLLLQSTGSRCAGFSSRSTRAQYLQLADPRACTPQ